VSNNYLYLDTKKRSTKQSILTKGLSKHKFTKSNQGINEHARHMRTSSHGSNLMTHSNQYGLNKGYSKLSDSTFKSGDFGKLKTEMEDLDFLDPNQSEKGHRRKTSAIKKVCVKTFSATPFIHILIPGVDWIHPQIQFE